MGERPVVSLFLELCGEFLVDNLRVCLERQVVEKLVQPFLVLGEGLVSGKEKEVTQNNVFKTREGLREFLVVVRIGLEGFQPGVKGAIPGPLARCLVVLLAHNLQSLESRVLVRLGKIHVKGDDARARLAEHVHHRCEVAARKRPAAKDVLTFLINGNDYDPLAGSAHPSELKAHVQRSEFDG